MKLRIGVFLAAVGVAGMAAAQVYSFGEALDGKKIPAVVKPKELPADYWALKITISGETSLLDLYGGEVAFQFRSGGGANDERQRAREALLQNSGVYWTKGQRVNIERQDYLVAYKLDIPIGAFVGSGTGFDTWALENPLELTLQLIRPESIAKMTPVPTLSPEKMSKAIEAFQRTLTDEFGSPVMTQGSNAARQTAALSNVKQLALGILMYQADYDDRFPSKQSTDHVRNVTRPYMKNDALWKTGNPNGGRFLFNVALSGFSSEDVDRPADMPMIYENTAWPDGRRAVAFTDGHAKLVNSNDWTKMESLLRAKLKHASSNAPPKKTPPKGGKDR